MSKNENRDTPSSSAYLGDHFIIAMPGLEDENFSQSVTYICDHNDTGAMGLTINRPTDIILSEVLSQSGIQNDTPDIGSQIIYHGGPVHTDRGFVLHSHSDHQWESSMQVSEQISLTTSRDILEAIAQGDGPQKTLITLGYAGWGPGQLEQEMSDNTWLSCKATAEIIFDTKVEMRWQKAAALLGIDLNFISNDTGHA